MISPYVRRHRLCSELRKLRAESGLTHAQLASKIGKDRQQISRLENGHSLDLDLVMQILEALAVDGDRWTQVVDAAREAGERGWWEPSARAMGERQALFADLEAGATTIREYQQTITPGLLQTPEFTRARLEADTAPLPPGMTRAGILKGRTGRQRVLNRPGGPTYELILNEFAVRRLSAPPEVLADQLRHLADRSDDDPVTIRMLPIDARIAEYNVPATSFMAFTYADPGDPTVILIETVTSGVVLTDPDEAERHTRLFDSLRDAALSVQDSRDLLTQAAERLSGG